MRFSTITLLRLAGLFTWLSVGIALIMIPLLGDGEGPRDDRSLWIWAHLIYGIAYWQLCNGLEGRGVLRENVLLALLMEICALVIAYTTQTGLGGILMLVIAGVLPWMLDLRFGVPWLILQNIVLSLVVSTFPTVTPSGAIVLLALYLGYSSFAFVLSLVARRQSRAREEMRKVNSELRATQFLLAESTQIAERVRIARELHDLVGHHLTALSLNLEVASHLVSGKALDHVTQALSVARLLLSDVREVVGAMRDDDRVELSEAIRSLTEGVPKPRIHLSMPDQLAIDDPRRAQVVLRCTQEIITNTVKHAQADNLWLAIDDEKEGLTIVARDDGHGSDSMSEGNGLMGMSERLEQYGGKLSVKTALGKGFTINAWLPKEVGL